MLMICHSLNMSHFRAINLPRKSPEKPESGIRSPSNASSASSPECPESRQLSPKVVLPAKRSNASHSGLPAAKADIGQAVAQAHKATHTSKKKKRKSDSSASKASRQQAPREKKLMYSIEHSPQKKTPSPTPLDDKKDGDYLPTAAELAATILSTAQSTPSRRSPRQDASTRRDTGSLAFPKPRPKLSVLQPSSQAACAFTFTKMESLAATCNSPGPEVGLEPKPPSPSLWSSQLRKERYQQNGVVELPKEVFEYLSSKKAKKRIDQQLAEKRKDMKEGKRKEKGKSAEQRPINETNEPNQRDQSEMKAGKKRPGDDLEKKGPCKRQRLQESRKSTDDISESKLKRVRSSSKAQGHRASVVKTEAPPDIADVPSAKGTWATNHSTEGNNTMRSRPPLGLEVPEERSGQFDDPALRSREKQGVPPNEDWRKPFRRREVHLGEGRTCSCKRLPEFFTKTPYDVPCLATWRATCRAGDREFFKHVKQISCCKGSVHPLYIINACRKMLEERLASNRGDTGSVVDSTQGILSKNCQESHNMRRAQSSIAPPVFYGSGDRSRQAPGPRSFTRFMPEMRKATTSSLESLTISKPSNRIFARPAPRNAPAKHDGVQNSAAHAYRPVDQLTTADAVRTSKAHPVPPNSCVSGKRNRAHMPTFDVYNDFTPDEELVGKEQTSNTLPEASKQPEHSFKAKRQRHQSVPANLPSRKPTVDELSLSRSPEPHRREGVLQEIYNHALLQNMNKTLAPITKCLKDLTKDLTDRFLPPPPAQTAAAASASAPANAPVPNAAPPQPENNAELPHVRKRNRKPVAERKRNLPERSRDVPAHLRLPDADLIAIGRKSNHYERHVAAPYAFTWHGHLLAEYDYLLRLEGNDWTAKEIKRVAG